MSTAAPTVTKRDLQALIKGAATGDKEQTERLLSPFLTPGERLVWSGVTAKMGLISVYDFGFLTDRRVGDLQITPLTGDLSVEVCYLQHIDAMVITQPAFSLKLWAGIIAAYPLWVAAAIGFSYVAGATTYEFLDNNTLAMFVFVAGAIGLSLLGIIGWTFFGIPAVRRGFLRYRKSGLWLKLRHSDIGSLIFADRNRFGLLAALTRMVTEQKRLLDKETRH